MLEDAEMKPSPRVWKAVSSRLDSAAAAAAGSSAIWARWAGAALAFAAVCVGVFFAATSGQDEISYSSPGMTLAYAPAEIHTAIPSARPLKALEARAAAVDMIEMSEELSEEASTTESSEEINTDDRTTKASPRTRRSYRSSSEVADPFALLAASEESRRLKAGRTALYAKGAIGGNDSDIRINSGSASMAPGKGGAGFSEESSSTYGVPFTLGLGVRVYVHPKISIGTGLDYSLLTRTFMGTYTDGAVSEAGTVTHSVQYLGIPLDVYYDIISTEMLKFYIYGGGEAEWCISNKYTLHSTPNIVGTTPVEKLLWSAGAGIGVEFKLSRHLGVYIDPSLRYYFPSDQPKSIRTDKPVIVNFDAGIRFNF